MINEVNRVELAVTSRSGLYFRFHIFLERKKSDDDDDGEAQSGGLRVFEKVFLFSLTRLVRRDVDWLIIHKPDSGRQHTKKKNERSRDSR
jgi:hypothetical protein